MTELSSLAQEELWTEGWEALYALEGVQLLNDQWQAISMDDARGLLQDNAYESKKWAFEETWYKGRPAIRISFTPVE